MKYIEMQHLEFKTQNPKPKTLKGIEGLALKYIVIILVAAIVIGVFVQIIIMLSATSLQSASQTNQTLNQILNKSIGNIIKQNLTG